MATQKQIFTEAHENIDKANHTTSGLIEYLRYIFGKLENASGGGGGGSEVSYTQKLTSGTETGTIEIDGVSTKMYAPTPTAPTEVEVTQVVSTGTKIATISVDDVPTDIYAPASGGGGGSVSIIADGVKTISQLINELYASVIHADLTPRAVLKYGDDVFPLINTNNQRDVFSQAFIQSSTIGVVRIIGRTSDSQIDQCLTSGGYTDLSSNVPASGTLIALYY